eukprot:TRINITY_DN70050_c0_g1_i1.p1 TRINITY_DN70050_c0_g1~~TRINITY_DN70050_c0_g1_i1.p1  ORF type:complete len:428 (-),score=74.38 TRINITY_DN70050_c0_g1_i1:201-1334(-)
MGAKISAPHPESKVIKGIGFDRYGEAKDVLKRVEVPYPHGFDVAKNVVIKVHASSINPIDQAIVTGKLKLLRPVAAFPHIISYDAAGVIAEADGEGKWAVGDPVMVRCFGDKAEDGPKTPWYRGCMSEYVVARSSHVVRKPDNISFEEAASIPLAGMTAFQAFKKMGLKEGDNVFITGGAGGVGTLAIQLAKHVFKAKLVATTASAGPKTELCKSLGADIVVDYKSANFDEVYGAEGTEKFDVCFDTTGESLKLVKVARPQGGRIITINGKPTLEQAREVQMEGGCLLGLFLPTTEKSQEYLAGAKNGVRWEYLFLSPNRGGLEDLADHLKAGTIKPILDNVWDFDNDDAKTGWKGAFEMAFSGRARGKCVVRFVNA